MGVFTTLFLKLVPLYVIIFLGYIAGTSLSVKKESIAPLLIYIIAPVIVFNGVLTTEITFAALSLPILFFVLCCCMSLLFLWVGNFFWKDSTKNILAFTSGSGNTGYFGLPVAVVLFDETLVGYAVLSILGFILYENSLGFFITAKGHHTAKEALVKVCKLPSLYAFLVGLLLNAAGVSFGQVYTDAATSFRGAYTVLGMMLIGLGLSGIVKFSFDYLFLALTFLAKFIVWPIAVLLIIVLDNQFLKLYTPAVHQVIILMSVVPLAANTVAFATELRAQPEKASLAVFLSTLFALLYIPFVTQFFIQN